MTRSAARFTGGRFKVRKSSRSTQRLSIIHAALRLGWFDMNANHSGDVTAKFADYSRKANRDLIERAFDGTDFLRNTPSPAKDLLASYPEQFGCSAKQLDSAVLASSVVSVARHSSFLQVLASLAAMFVFRM